MEGIVRIFPTFFNAKQTIELCQNEVGVDITIVIFSCILSTLT